MKNIKIQIKIMLLEAFLRFFLVFPRFLYVFFKFSNAKNLSLRGAKNPGLEGAQNPGLGGLKT